ncbi:hypothetical protein Tco_1169002 [Tanacetum coccineum]
MQSPFSQSPPKGSSQTKGEHIKKDKGKKALSLEKGVKESTESDSDDEHLGFLTPIFFTIQFHVSKFASPSTQFLIGMGLLTMIVGVGFFGLYTFLPPDFENMNSLMSLFMASLYHLSNAFDDPLLDTVASELLLSKEMFESLKLLQRQLFRSLEDWEVSSLQFMQRYRNERRPLVGASVQLG